MVFSSGKYTTVPWNLHGAQPLTPQFTLTGFSVMSPIASGKVLVLSFLKHPCKAHRTSGPWMTERDLELDGFSESFWGWWGQLVISGTNKTIKSTSRFLLERNNHVSSSRWKTYVYCWWFRNPGNSPGEVGSLSIIYMVLHPRWCRIWAINSIALSLKTMKSLFWLHLLSSFKLLSCFPIVEFMRIVACGTRWLHISMVSHLMFSQTQLFLGVLRHDLVRDSRQDILQFFPPQDLRRFCGIFSQSVSLLHNIRQPWCNFSNWGFKCPKSPHRLRDDFTHSRFLFCHGRRVAWPSKLIPNKHTSNQPCLSYSASS